MTYKKPDNVDTIKNTLLEAHGNISVAAKRFGVSRQTLYDWIKEHDLGDVVNEGRESIIDLAENQLAKKIGEGDTTSIIFMLKTQGKKRGYVERQEIAGSITNTNINTETATAEDAAKAYQEIVKGK